MNKELKMAYAAPIMVAVINSIGCDDQDRCVDITLSLLSKLEQKINETI